MHGDGATPVDWLPAQQRHGGRAGLCEALLLVRGEAGEAQAEPTLEFEGHGGPVFDPAPEPEERPEKVPFYKKVLAHTHEKDSRGFGPNWSNVDDYDIPTVLRKHMD